MRHILAALVVALTAAHLLPAAAEPAAGPVLVTVTGAIALTNRVPFDPFRDSFLKFHNKSFDKAFGFDWAALARLPQHTITAQAEGWPRAVAMSGPRLTDVLEKAGAAGRPVTLLALDGYAVELSLQDLAARDWILAIAADGEPLALGGREPAWLASDTAGRAPATPEEEAKWAWSVFLIEVK
jgi:hypothetical protein